MTPIRVAVLLDHVEEGWLSMDLVGSAIVDHLNRRGGGEVEAAAIRPPFRARLGRFPGKSARLADRLINRHADYPGYARGLGRGGAFDLFHVVDHSYAHLVGPLPGPRSVVTCHDLDAFRCLVDPIAEPRPAWFRALSRRTLRGLRAASAVVADSESTRLGLVGHGLVDPGRLRTVPLGVYPEFAPEADPAADRRATDLLGPVDPGRPELLHVGSNIPRKRVDVLLRVFEGVRRSIPGARLVKVGGAFPPGHQAMAEGLGVARSIVVAPPLSPTSAADRSTLAALYRRAALVLLPSESEGFGLPAIEALACGTPLLSSDLPVLREVAGEAATYRAVGDVKGWTEAALTLLGPGGASGEAASGRRREGLDRARRSGWAVHVDRLVGIYREVLSGGLG